MQMIEVRCPVGPKRLFAKLRSDGIPPVITDGNLIEFSCAECKKQFAAHGIACTRVLHRYNLIGELVESTLEGVGIR